MQIFVNRGFSCTYSIDIEDSATIGCLMEIIQDKCGIATKHQSLLFNGTRLVHPYYYTLWYRIHEDVIQDDLRILKIQTFNGTHNYVISTDVSQAEAHELIQSKLEQTYAEEWKSHLTTMVNNHSHACRKTLKDHNIRHQDKIYLLF
jgi:hypothetical protein